MLHHSLFTRSFAALLSLLLVPAAQAVQAPPQSVATSPQAQATPQMAEIQPQGSTLPNAPSPQEVSQNADQNNSQQNPKQQNSSTAPVGTAAAPPKSPSERQGPGQPVR